MLERIRRPGFNQVDLHFFLTPYCIQNKKRLISLKSLNMSRNREMEVNDKILKAKHLLEDAAFMVSSGKELPDAHRNIIKALVSLEEIESMLSNTDSSASVEMSEVSKVSRRLKLWAKRPEQINARILRAFLNLSSQSASPITESQLRDAVGGGNFDTNFAQMKNISDKNHGKVFDVIADVVSIWKPVASAVNEFDVATK